MAFYHGGLPLVLRYSFSFQLAVQAFYFGDCPISPELEKKKQKETKLERNSDNHISDQRHSMCKTSPSAQEHGETALYEIRIRGHLDNRWASWFDGLTITLEENGESRLIGPVADQAALYGLLRKVRDVGMPLLSVVCIDSSQGDDGLDGR
ncbi:MAG: hypothetical protein AAF629_19840 [Chloroflexota bacterium]